MKKLIPSFCFILLMLQGAYSQNIFFCGYDTKPLPPLACNHLLGNAMQSEKEAVEVVEKILRQLGLSSNKFTLLSCPDIKNAAAMLQNNKRFILYDRTFLTRLSSSNSDWEAISILAHEIGHHLLGHTLSDWENYPESHEKELDADHFAGFQLYKLGATLEQAQSSVRQVATEFNDSYSTHPKLSRRLKAVEEGYNEAKTQTPQVEKKEDINPKVPNMVYVEENSFIMGDDGIFQKAHFVSISSFYLSKYEVSVEEFKKFITDTEYQTSADKSGSSSAVSLVAWDENRWGKNWLYDGTGKLRPVTDYNHPVVNVSWLDAVYYCNWLSAKEGLKVVYYKDDSGIVADWTANGYRLPTEAEWEFAASREPIKTRGNIPDIKARELVSKSARYKLDKKYNDSYATSAPVDQFEQVLGIHNILGNVAEWCWDWYDYDYYELSANMRDPRGPANGHKIRGMNGFYKPVEEKVIRGGSWFESSGIKGRTSKEYDESFGWVGFRLARNAD